MESKDRVINATLSVIESGGVKEVTIRRVAQELGRSTTVITHYFSNRQELIAATLDQSLLASKNAALGSIEHSDDRLWAFLDWSISEEHGALWEALIAAHAAGLDPEVSKHVEDLLAWWDDLLLELLNERNLQGSISLEVCDIIGVVVEGILLNSSRPTYSGITGTQLLRKAVGHLLQQN